MALPPDKTNTSNAQQDVFLREVDDALRQDQFEGFLSRYGKPLGAAIVVALAAFGGLLTWNHYRTKGYEGRTEAFVQAGDRLQASNLDGAAEKLRPIAATNGSDANASSARLMLGAIALKQNKPADALKLFRQVADDANAPQPLRDLASVRAVATNFDAMQPQDVIAQLKPLAVPGNPWFGPAAELVGMAYLKQGNQGQAGPLFAAIAKDKTADPGLRSRAGQLAAALGVDAVADIVNEKGEPYGKTPAKAADGE